ncbi:MAG TPA: hypothetical protein VE981_07300, partial [Planctomycetota bacterium]|nr:hypothetical protein [Planctomycetota bacterium]
MKPAPAPATAGRRIVVVDAENRVLREARLALLTRDAFTPQNRLRDEAIAAAPDRLRVLVENREGGGPDSLSIVVRSSGTLLMLPLSGPPDRLVSPPFLLLGDKEDAAAAGSALAAVPGDRLEIRIGDAAVAEIRVGPSVIHQIPIRFVAVGPGIPSAGDLEKAIELRLLQANAVWEPFGRRFVRGSVSRLDSFQGLALVRGRAAGVDAQGHPSRSGLKVDGRELSVPCVWRDDGAPLSPKAASRALLERAGRAYKVDLYDGLAGDREAVVLRWRHADGSPARLDRLEGTADVAQSAAPLAIDLRDGLEVAPSPALLSLEETALLATGKTG